MTEQRPELPPLHEALLDAASLDAVLLDLEALAQVSDVRVKGGANRHALDGRLTLAEARAALVGGTAHGVQIRYRWQGADWCDTLLRAPGGIRLVRMRQD